MLHSKCRLSQVNFPKIPFVHEASVERDQLTLDPFVYKNQFEKLSRQQNALFELINLFNFKICQNFNPSLLTSY